jgi:hypothetical protein
MDYKSPLARLLLLAVLIAVVSAVAYLPSLGYDFVKFDDDDYVTENPYLKSPDLTFVKWAVVSFYPDNWFPMVWLSYSLDYALWGLNPMGYHLTNVLLHMMNTLLVVMLAALLFRVSFGVLNEKGLFMAVLVGAIFGLHPLHVESVVWVSERKDVLYAFFWLLSLLAYMKYAEMRAFNKRALYYILCLGLFSFSLMSKPMAVTLPLVFLIIDCYPLRRLALGKGFMRVAVLEKLPFYALSIGCAKLAMMAQSGIGAVISTDSFPLWQRFWVAVKALRLYIQKFILPIDLAPFYPLPEIVNPFSFEYLGSLALVLGITVVCLVFVKKAPALMAAWSYFVITLLPVLGLVKVGFIIGADRYMYLPMLGPLVMLSIGASRLLEGKKRKPLIVFIIIIMIVLSVMTVMQGRIWKDSLTLRYFMAMNVPETPKPYADSAFEHMRAGRYESAVKDMTQAISLVSGQWGQTYKPELHNYYNSRGNAYFALKKYDMAVEDYGMAISYKPEEAEYYYNRALSFGRLNLLDKAISEYRKSISHDPDFAPVYNNLGTAYVRRGDYERAMENLDMAISLAGGRGDYYYNRGQVHEIAGNKDHAIRDYRSALRLGDEAARERLGFLGAAP